VGNVGGFPDILKTTTASGNIPRTMETSTEPTSEEIRLSVWQMLSSHQSVRVLRNHVDPPMFAKISAMESELTKQFTTVEYEVLAELDSIPAELSNTEKRKFAETCKHTDILLRIMNHQPYTQLIWETIKPAAD
jgi:hypothetical protein